LLKGKRGDEHGHHTIAQALSPPYLDGRHTSAQYSEQCADQDERMPDLSQDPSSERKRGARQPDKPD
jgi:hypothetical protein